MRAIQIAVITGLILATIILAGCATEVVKPVTLHTYIPDRAFIQPGMKRCHFMGRALVGSHLAMRYSCEKPGEA